MIFDRRPPYSAWVSIIVFITATTIVVPAIVVSFHDEKTIIDYKEQDEYRIVEGEVEVCSQIQKRQVQEYLSQCRMNYLTKPINDITRDGLYTLKALEGADAACREGGIQEFCSYSNKNIVERCTEFEGSCIWTKVRSFDLEK